MSIYTDARSRPGTKGVSGTDDRQLFLTEFGGMVLQSYDETMDYQDMRWMKEISQGKADSFPIIGRKRDASEHTPGDLIVGGTITHDEVVITVDQMLTDSAFIADIDQMLLHYEISEPYANQIGQSLGSITAKRIAIMHIIASRAGVTGAGQPVPAYYFNAALKTDASKLEDAAFKARQYLLENDISGDQPFFMLPFQQVLLLARYTGVDNKSSSGSGNRASGTIQDVAGLTPKGTNHIPSTNITTGNAKYQGNFSTTVGHIGSRMAVGSLQLRAMKLVMKEQEERLGTIMIGSKLDGHGPLRNECSIELRTDVIGGRTSL